jgi:hypothetical protein
MTTGEKIIAKLEDVCLDTHKSFGLLDLAVDRLTIAALIDGELKPVNDELTRLGKIEELYLKMLEDKEANAQRAAERICRLVYDYAPFLTEKQVRDIILNP